MSDGKIAIDEVIVGNRHRKDIGDITDLARSINTIGLLHPIVIDKNSNLIAGLRRLESVKILDWDEIPCLVVADLEDAAKALIAERDENTCRKNFTTVEAVALGKALEELESPKAKERQRAAGGNHSKKIACDNLSQAPADKRKTREKVGAALGMSGTTYQRAKAVVTAAEEDPEMFGGVAEEMNETGKVTTAFNKVQQMKRDPESALAVIDNKKNAKPSRAIRHAYDAIDCLKRILPSDSDRKRGFQIVADYIKANK